MDAKEARELAKQGTISAIEKHIEIEAKKGFNEINLSEFDINISDEIKEYFTKKDFKWKLGDVLSWKE